MFKNYTINQTTLPLDTEQYIPETDVAFTVNALVESIPPLSSIGIRTWSSSLSSKNDVKNYSLCVYPTSTFWKKN